MKIPDWLYKLLRRTGLRAFQGVTDDEQGRLIRSQIAVWVDPYKVNDYRRVLLLYRLRKKILRETPELQEVTFKWRPGIMAYEVELLVDPKSKISRTALHSTMNTLFVTGLKAHPLAGRSIKTTLPQELVQDRAPLLEQGVGNEHF